MSINIELFERISKEISIDLKKSQDSPMSSDQHSRVNFVDPSVKEFHDKVIAMTMKFGPSVIFKR